MIKANKHIILGLGKTGLSVAHFLTKQGVSCMVCDSRPNPPELLSLQAQLPQVVVKCGAFDATLLSGAQILYVSPGLDLQDPAIIYAEQNGVKISGDIDLFSQYAKAPIVAITGTNGKSTVTTLVGNMAQKAGKKVAVGGNLGTPILDLVADDVELYVVEVSSFQLDTCAKLGAKVATCLNIADDHQDRYASFNDYVNSKLKVANRAQIVVINSDLDNFSLKNKQIVTFGLDKKADFHLNQQDGTTYLFYKQQNLISADELKIKGQHNWLNALASLAIGFSINLNVPSMLNALRDFQGLEHRCQWVANIGGVDYYNDSKATNVASSVAAISGIGANINGKIILLAGGLGKGADFAVLNNCVQQYCREVLLFGSDANLISQSIKNTPYKIVDSLFCAVQSAKKIAQAGDVVLLAPACASMDQFANFEERGRAFVTEVANLC